MSFELYQQGPSIYLPVLLLSLIITVFSYGAFPFIFAKIRRTSVAKKTYRRRCFFVNIAVMFLFVVISGNSPNGIPYIFWTWIFSNWGVKILNSRGLLTDTTADSTKSTPSAVQEKVCPDVDSIRFCRKCGEKLLDNSIFCRKCGTKIIKE